MGTHPIFESDFDCLTEMGFSGTLIGAAVGGAVFGAAGLIVAGPLGGMAGAKMGAEAAVAVAGAAVVVEAGAGAAVAAGAVIGHCAQEMRPRPRGFDVFLDPSWIRI